VRKSDSSQQWLSLVNVYAVPEWNIETSPPLYPTLSLPTQRDAEPETRTSLAFPVESDRND